MSENYFNDLYNIDVRSKTKKKNNLNYLSWAAAWAEVKKRHPDATYRIFHFMMAVTKTVDDKTITYSIERPWHDDGKTGWVKVGVTIGGLEHIEELPVMDYKNSPIPAESITSAEANKSIQRALTKACARHGLGLYLYEGEDMPEDSKEIEILRKSCMDNINKKYKIPELKDKVSALCKEILPEENGSPNNCDDKEKLEKLNKALLALRAVKPQK